jgi:hypothetical protein
MKLIATVHLAELYFITKPSKFDETVQEIEKHLNEIK